MEVVSKFIAVATKESILITNEGDFKINKGDEVEIMDCENKIDFSSSEPAKYYLKSEDRFLIGAVLMGDFRPNRKEYYNSETGTLIKNIPII
jgi:hypothetical protein